MNIKNVIFDIGNVMVRWHTPEIVRLTFGEQLTSKEQNGQDNIATLASKLFANDLWLDLNKGSISEKQAKHSYQHRFNLTQHEVDDLFYYIKHTQIVLAGSLDLLTRVKAAGYGVYALTDNLTTIVEHLKTVYNFWDMFDGAVVSADVGCLKPSAQIYNILLNQQNLKAAECLFLDDRQTNVDGAIAVGMHAIQFTHARQAEQLLKTQYGLVF